MLDKSLIRSAMTRICNQCTAFVIAIFYVDTFPVFQRFPMAAFINPFLRFFPCITFILQEFPVLDIHAFSRRKCFDLFGFWEIPESLIRSTVAGEYDNGRTIVFVVAYNIHAILASIGP